MKLVVFGGQGGTGRLVVEQALARGHEVTIASRAARTSADGKVTARTCEVTDPAQVAAAVAGQDAVVLAIGTGHVKPSTLRTDAARNVVAGMAIHDVRRLVAISGLGAGDSLARQPWIFRAIVARLALGGLLADQNGLEAAIRAAPSDLAWVIARPGQLVDRPARGPVVTSLDGGGVASKVSRAALATFLLDQLVEDRFLRQAVAVGDP